MSAKIRVVASPSSSPSPNSHRLSYALGKTQVEADWGPGGSSTFAPHSTLPLAMTSTEGSRYEHTVKGPSEVAGLMRGRQYVTGDMRLRWGDQKVDKPMLTSLHPSLSSIRCWFNCRPARRNRTLPLLPFRFPSVSSYGGSQGVMSSWQLSVRTSTSDLKKKKK